MDSSSDEDREVTQQRKRSRFYGNTPPRSSKPKTRTNSSQLLATQDPTLLERQIRKANRDRRQVTESVANLFLKEEEEVVETRVEETPSNFVVNLFSKLNPFAINAKNSSLEPQPSSSRQATRFDNFVPSAPKIEFSDDEEEDDKFSRHLDQTARININWVKFPTMPNPEGTSSGSVNPINNYITVSSHPALQDRFDGTTNVESFLNRFETVARSYGWGHETRAANFPLYIKGGPKAWYFAYVLKEANAKGVDTDGYVADWATLKAEFKRRFPSTVTKEEKERRLKAKRFQRKDKLEPFYWELVRLMLLVDPQMPEREQINYFIKSLPTDLATWFYDKSPQTMAKVEELIHEREKFKSLMGLSHEAHNLEGSADLSASIAKHLVAHFANMSVGSDSARKNKFLQDDQSGKFGDSKRNVSGSGQGQSKGYNIKRKSKKGNRGYWKNNIQKQQKNQQGNGSSNGGNGNRQWYNKKRSNQTNNSNRKFENPDNNQRQNNFSQKALVPSSSSLNAQRQITGEPNCYTCRGYGHTSHYCPNKMGNSFQ